MSTRHKFQIAAATATGALLLGVTAVQAADYTLKIGHVAAVAQPMYTCVEVMKSYVERYSNGRVAVEHYPAGQLGNFRQNVEQIQLGTLEMSITTGGGISNVFGPIQAFDIPYLYRDDRVIRKFMQDEELTARLRKDVLEATGTVLLLGMSGDHGWRDFFSSEPVRTAADLEGVKMRTIESPISMELARALGMNPTPVPWPELYTSLATGIVNGTKNSLSDVMDTNLNEFLKYAVEDHHTYTIFFWWMHKPWLDSLPQELQGVVLDGYWALTNTCNGLLDSLMLEKNKKFAEAGGTMHIPTAEEKASFLPGQKAVADWFVEKYGPEYYDLVKAAVKRAEAAVDAERAAIAGG